ncbi:U32 family peptidase [Spiractinospora alimapuensis]|uniref:U32 family peptidase n=1 Tax=Spiractinospora alimapuensis TaxID=2820884 RepID=UPI001F3875BE|nr:U32 family peptidase [Spiractinospora alimapuensis]
MTSPSSPYVAGRAGLAAVGINDIAADPPTSTRHFPDGGAWRLEIPSVEGPRALAEVLQAAASWDVPVHRVSQGSGVGMLTDAEITEMVHATADADIELCLFVRPGANWDIGAAHFTPAGSVSTRSRGNAQLAAGVAEAERAVRLGVRSLLVADEGLLWVLHQLRANGDLPAELQLKVSVMAGPANPAALRVQEYLGADTVNVPSDLTLHQLAELRATSPVTLDFYVEAPDNIGGFVRHHEITEIVRVAAPVYVKFGLRNATDVYPAGEQLDGTVLPSARERVRRARLGLDVMENVPTPPTMSPLGTRDQPRAQRFTPPGAAVDT